MSTKEEERGPYLTVSSNLCVFGLLRPPIYRKKILTSKKEKRGGGDAVFPAFTTYQGKGERGRAQPKWKYGMAHEKALQGGKNLKGRGKGELQAFFRSGGKGNDRIPSV